MSGCSSSGVDELQRTTEIELGDTEGAVRVVVLDDSLNPVVDATVGLDGEHQAETAMDGVADFRPVAAGEHVVSASKFGFTEASRAMTVEAGVVAEVVLTIEATASLGAYFETVIQNGIVGCSAAAKAGSPSSAPIGVCGTLTSAGTNPLDTFALDWPINPQAETLSGFWGETTWISSQVFGSGMSITWFAAETGFTGSAFASPEDQDVRVVLTVEGVSPIGARLPIDIVRNVAGDVVSTPLCDAEECFLISGHYVSAETSGLAIDLGVSFQQRYEDFLTSFHNMPLPDAFTVVPDQ